MKKNVITKLISFFGLSLASVATSTIAHAANLVPLDLYWSDQRGDYLSIATADGARDAAQAGYRYLGTQACVFDAQEAGTGPLALFWNAERGDNDTIATAGGLGDANTYGYNYIRTEGYVYQSQYQGTIPLYLFWSPGFLDNFLATQQQAARAARLGYSYVRTEGFAYPASSCRRDVR